MKRQENIEIVIEMTSEELFPAARCLDCYTNRTVIPRVGNDLLRRVRCVVQLPYVLHTYGTQHREWRKCECDPCAG
jgi:hypothetical protein